jgi:putative endonuclease
MFVEVKTRRAGAREHTRGHDAQPLEGLTRGKCARVRRLAVAWLCEAGQVRPTARTIRFDAIGVVLDPHGRLLRLDHVEGAW